MVERDPFTPRAIAELERLHTFDANDLSVIFARGVSRDELRALPLRFIIIPCNTAPVLELAWGDEGRAELLREQIKAVRELYPRTIEPKKRARLALRARRAWCQLVELAIGTSVPGLPFAVLEFRS